MDVSDSGLVALRDSRSPLYASMCSLASEERAEVCRRALPIFTGVSSRDAAPFEARLREAASQGRADLLLSLVRDSFTEFLYDDFPQLEGHYQDVLAVMTGLLHGVLTDCSFRPGVVEWLLLTDNTPLHVVFNLRGSAEEAAEKSSLCPEDGIRRIGVSFSAFDRRIDRWSPI